MIEGTTDTIKLLGEWALTAGKQLQSAQTGFVHYTQGQSLQEKGQTIPVYENALFVLTLFRSRLMESMQEAKELLQNLLAFQVPTGNFPFYLHQYPRCLDSTLAIQVLAPFYWTLAQFGHVLGTSLKQQLVQAFEQALHYSLQAQTNQPFPYSFAVRLAAARVAYSRLTANQAEEKAGLEQLSLLAEQQSLHFYRTAYLSEILIGLQMVYPVLQESIWQPLWQHMEQTWHPTMGSYMGPLIREWQKEREPQPYLYDLYAGYYAQQFSQRAKLVQPFHLQGVLIQPSKEQFIYKQVPCQIAGKVKEAHWQTQQETTKAYTLLEKTEPLPPTTAKTYTPFHLLWGDAICSHSLVCQGGNYEKVRYEQQEKHILLFFELGEETPKEDKDKQQEIEFFIDHQPDFHLTSQGKPTSTFQLGEEICLQVGNQQIKMTFDLMTGEGHFFGHLMRSNRPSQIGMKGEQRYQGYDWTIFLRTIRRQGACQVKVKIEMPLDHEEMV